ncbi:glutaredoxin family protein [Tahibacter amnicola]|uniref:Glutaredoxin family protein n=1 Tax=Tahibacter amnicola TaxID=2976241 RepID=A0ABY6BBA6_9GAMM|nr:glutaredoxin family protein [Tahibacter amnicola]UXI67343.1 glutaredoxin family protein [Tahibacter amnicola]
MRIGPLQLFIAAGVLLLLGVSYSSYREIMQHDPRRQTGNDGIVMLSAEWCGYCTKLRAGLDEASVPYTLMDIEESEAAEDAYFALGARGVPVTVVGQEVVYGYDADRITRLLADRGYRVRLK